MTREEIIAMIQAKLSVHIIIGDTNISVRLKWDGEEICYDTDSLPVPVKNYSGYESGRG